MQSTNSEYGSPYLAVCHFTFTFKKNIKYVGTDSLVDSVLTYNGVALQVSEFQSQLEGLSRSHPLSLSYITSFLLYAVLS